MEVECNPENIVFQMVMPATTVAMRQRLGEGESAGAHEDSHSGSVSVFGVIFLADSLTGAAVKLE